MTRPARLVELCVVGVVLAVLSLLAVQGARTAVAGALALAEQRQADVTAAVGRYEQAVAAVTGEPAPPPRDPALAETPAVQAARAFVAGPATDLPSPAWALVPAALLLRPRARRRGPLPVVLTGLSAGAARCGPADRLGTPLLSVGGGERLP